MIDKCECGDPGCPVCHGECHNKGEIILYRVDMEDETGTLFCLKCAEDAMESGLFSTDEILEREG